MKWNGLRKDSADDRNGMAEWRETAMTNADMFRAVFNGLMATKLWAKPESEFLEWLNAEAISNETFRKDCFSCANGFVDDDDNLHCMACGHNHEEVVKDDYVCEDWN